MPKISRTIATYFAEKYIKSCLDSILNQTFKDFEIIVIDNNSTDNTLSIIRKEYPLNNIKILENKENLGFAKAHNKGISTSSAEYILVTNQDIILEPDFLEKIVNFMDNNKSYASCGGKLLKMIYEDNKFKKTNTIDCIGLNHTKGYRFYNIGEGEIDNSQYDRDINLFGISGALVLYRKESLDKTKDQYGYFD